MKEKIDRSLFLGSTEDPQPVWRDEAEDADSWPEGAVFRIEFTRERFPHVNERQCRLPRTDCFGCDGWPCDLPEEIKHQLPESLKSEFQVFPWDWRDWDEETWRRARLWPEHCAQIRVLSSALSPLAEIASSLA
jgi:cation transport regulator ChaB